MIAIIDVIGNNLTSLVNSIQRLGFDCVLTHNVEQIKRASHVILPGVGAAMPAMQALHEHQLIEVIKQLTAPVLGICLGMQLLFDHTDEEDVDCLGLMAGRVHRLLLIPGYPVPHMGWNRLHWRGPRWPGICDQSYVYFVHGFAVTSCEYTVATCQYSSEFSAIVQKNNVYGMQFHPEKSADIGLKLLAHFLTLEAVC